MQVRFLLPISFVAVAVAVLFRPIPLAWDEEVWGTVELKDASVEISSLYGYVMRFLEIVESNCLAVSECGPVFCADAN